MIYIRFDDTVFLARTYFVTDCIIVVYENHSQQISLVVVIYCTR